MALAAPNAEHPGRIAVLGNAVAAKIGEMGGKRRVLHAVTHDPDLDHRRAGSLCHSPRRGEARGAAPAEGAVTAWRWGAVADPARLFGGGERLGDEGLGALAPRRSDPAQPDAEIIVQFHSETTRKVAKFQCSQ